MTTLIGQRLDKLFCSVAAHTHLPAGKLRGRAGVAGTVLCASLLAGGCHKSSQSSAASGVAPGTSATQNAAPNRLPLPPSGATHLSPDAQQSLDTMNQLVRAYVRRKKTIPKRLNDLVTSGFVTHLPAPPAGKHFAIQLYPMGYRVILANN